MTGPPDVTDVSVRKPINTYDQIIVKGSNRSIGGESFEASTSFHNLNRNSLITGSETVYDDSGTNYERGSDYEIDYSEGQIRTTSSSDLDDGSSYPIDYDIEVSGKYPQDDEVDDPDEFVDTVPAVQSTRGAEQIAYVVYQRVSEPRYEVDVTLSQKDIKEFDPLESLDFEALGLPDEATPLSVREPPEITPEGITLRLGSRNRLTESLNSIADQIRTVSEQV